MHGAAWLKMIVDGRFAPPEPGPLGPKVQFIPIPFMLVGRRWQIRPLPPAPFPQLVPLPSRWGFDDPQLRAAWHAHIRALDVLAAWALWLPRR